MPEAAMQLSADRRPPVAWMIVGGLLAIKLGLHLGTNALSPYEFHRDEFLYMAMGEHLRLFTMDFPPFIAMLSEATRGLLGDSVFALRLPPALLSTALLLIAALSARELGGGRFAQGLAGLCVLASGLYLRTGGLFMPVVIDQLWWTLGLFSLVKLAKTEDPRWWLGFGVACGFGLLSKFSMLVFGFAVLMALLVTPARQHLRTRWPWFGAVTALLIGSPAFIGQMRLGWPVVDYMGDLRSAQLALVSPVDFLLDQPLMGLGFFVAVVGVAALAFSPKWKPYRLVGWSALIVFITLMILQGKSYYIGPIYPVLYGAGAVVLERFRRPRWGAVVRRLTVGSIAAHGLFSIPISLPILEPAAIEEYLVAIGMQELLAETNVGTQGRIPQDFADMLNWREQVEEIARVYETLPPADRARAVILASNYGEAGAIDFYGPSYDLPPARAFVGPYWYFGPGDLPGQVLILHGFGADDFADFCDSHTAAGSVGHEFAVAEQRNVTIFICRGPLRSLQAQWPLWEGEQ